MIDMEKIEKLEKAISFLDSLSNGIDPLTNSAITADTFKREELVELITFSSTILTDVLNNKGEVIQVVRPAKFDSKFVNIANVKISQKPIAISTLVMNINKESTNRKMRNLGASIVKNWLVGNGYVTEEKVAVLKNVNELRLTEKSQEVGIIEESVVDPSTGEVRSAVKLTDKAQNFIISNLATIISENQN